MYGIEGFRTLIYVTVVTYCFGRQLDLVGMPAPPTSLGGGSPNTVDRMYGTLVNLKLRFP